MELEIVSKEIATELKELGFNWKCNRFYFPLLQWLCSYEDYEGNCDIKIPAPTQALVCKWFREVKHIKVLTKHSDIGTYNYEIRIVTEPNQIGKWERIGNINSYNTYELAEEAGIIKAIEILKNKE